MIDGSRQQALKQAQCIQISKELISFSFHADHHLIQTTALYLELSVMNLIENGLPEEDENRMELRIAARDAFRLLKALPRLDDPLEDGLYLLRTSALAVLGDRGVDASRWLREIEWPELPIDSQDWMERTWATVVDVWLRLIRKNGWSDRDIVLERVSSLRDAQALLEKEMLQKLDSSNAKSTALELIALYHLAKAAEIFAHYITDGVVDGKYQIQQLLDTHFDKTLVACQHAMMIHLEPLTILLYAATSQMVENSIWSVTRAVNSRVEYFVKTLIDRGRGDKVIFDVLPPQRRVLAEKGLLGSSRRAVVVSLPTSSGKTMIAEFRILQALNQFAMDRGWVAYLVPTRALVHQVCRQLRKDLSDLEINVEEISPVLEIDSIESDLLQNDERENEFHVLVTTPEKMNLLLRQDWESKIDRPLTLVIVDEAHNIQNAQRGLHLELLLATVNSECRYAQFLLLTPFIENAHEVARWLGGSNSQDISLSVDWQPNDRVIGVIQPEKTDQIRGRSFNYKLNMETVHTSKQTLIVDDFLDLENNKDIASTYSQACNSSTLAAITAQNLSSRGPIIVMHSRPDWVWSLAERLKIDQNKTEVTDNIALVQKFLELELGGENPLIDLLSYRIGVHHAGLPDEVRTLIEWLFEKEELHFLVATTTIAQGVNFPVSGVVMASHQYPYGMNMPPEDFWNIAGRVGRISHGSLGVVALVAESSEKADKLRQFINHQSGELNSMLIELVHESRENLNDLIGLVYHKPQWSAFVQYLTHTYQQMGKPEDFKDKAEQVVRNTFGFRKLKTENSTLADQFLEGVLSYAEYIERPGQPIGLVDSTGFSLESVTRVLQEFRTQGISDQAWNNQTLFSPNNQDLQNMMGILLRVPELRNQLKDFTGGETPESQKLSDIVKDWVNGVSLVDIAHEYFNEGDDPIKSLTKCSQKLFGNILQTTAWGLGALLSMTGNKMPNNEMPSSTNLPSYVYYGVNDDKAIALRLLGVSRSAAVKLSTEMDDIIDQPLVSLRNHLRSMDKQSWQKVLGEQRGEIYRSVWRVLEGLDVD
ncbi:MAG: DEAD/DEAH box helicase [Bacteroidetes bacterium]|nr:DEAD/DEAH box helicase [Bacteroidota bacterium]